MSEGKHRAPETGGRHRKPDVAARWPINHPELRTGRARHAAPEELTEKQLAARNTRG